MSSAEDDELLLEWNPSFAFGDANQELPPPTTKRFGVAVPRPTGGQRKTLDEKISEIRQRTTQRRQQVGENNDDIDQDDDGEQDDIVRDRLAANVDNKSGRTTTENDLATIDYSEVVEDYDRGLKFTQMHLSRPLLRALNQMNFTQPTAIQSACIPILLHGKDVCACAATGSGKTAAYMLPILERLLFRPRADAATRVLVLVPTRELALQVHQVSRQLAQFTGVEIGVTTGGLDVKRQEALLRRGPDIVVATPGRLIDHLHNAPGFSLNNIEILVLDEADRMLDEYFQEQMAEVIKLCSATRQTMLFSATMTEKVRDLAAVSLRQPVRVFLNSSTDTVDTLVQEFVRIRPQREDDREAIVLALLKRTFKSRVIVFVQTKKLAHRLRVLLGLAGLAVRELHGNLTQEQRMDSLDKFKEGSCAVLVASDLASRGLDIEGVDTILNFTMPPTLKRYIHRVGRTARAGRVGRAVTLVSDDDRKLLKELVKNSRSAVKQRTVPVDVVHKLRSYIEKIEPEIEEVLTAEKEEKLIEASEADLLKAERILNRKPAKNGPVSNGPNQTAAKQQKRKWFQTNREKRKAKKARRQLNESGESFVQKAAAKSAKAGMKSKKMRVCAETSGSTRGATRKAAKPSKSRFKKSKSLFS